MNRFILAAFLAIGCGASSGDADDSDEVDEGALGACSECKSPAELLNKSVVVEITNGGTDAEREEFRATNAKLSKLMEAGIKNLPHVNDAALGPNLEKGSLRFITTSPTDGAEVAVHGALAQALFGLGKRDGIDVVIAGASCRIEDQPSLKGGDVKGARCGWKLPASRVKIEPVRRDKLSDADVARLLNLAYEPRK